MAVEDVARAFNIPPHLLGLPGTNTYASVEQNNIAFVTHTLRPIVSKIETAMSRLLKILPGGENAFIKFSMDGLLRGDANSRFGAYSTGIQAGYLTVNDIRRFEDLYPIEGGDVLRVPLANVNIDAADLVADDKRVTMANKLILAGFEPAEVLAAFGLPAIPHKVGVLSGGAKFVSDQLDNDKSQFIDSRRMAVEDVARAFNIPPHLLGLPGTNTYASVEQNNSLS